MASVKFRLKNPKNQSSIIVVRFYSKQTGPLDFSTGENIPTEFWDGQRVSSKYKKECQQINRHLSTIESDLREIWRDNKSAPQEKLKALVSKAVRGHMAPDEKKTVAYALSQFIAQYEREKEKTTAGRYKVLLNKLTAFNPKLTFEDLNQTFYDEFKQWLYGNDNPLYTGFDLRYDSDSGVHIMFASDKPIHRIGLFDDVVFKYLVNLQTVIRWAEKRGYQVNPAYKEWEIIKREYPVISLTLDELQRVENLCTLPAHLTTAQSYLSILSRTGQRISDVKRISSLATSSGTWKIHQKKGSRQKQKVVELPLIGGLCEPVKDIVAKYNGTLPQISEQRLNEHIKTICKLAGIDQETYIERWQGSRKIRIPGKKYEFISTHSGKKTFITILGGLGIPVKAISDLTGTSIRTIEKHYLGRTEMHVLEGYLGKIEGGQKLKKAN